MVWTGQNVVDVYTFNLDRFNFEFWFNIKITVHTMERHLYLGTSIVFLRRQNHDNQINAKFEKILFIILNLVAYY